MKRYIIAGCLFVALGVVSLPAHSGATPDCSHCPDNYKACMKNAKVKDNPKRQAELERDCSKRNDECTKGCKDQTRKPN